MMLDRQQERAHIRAAALEESLARRAWPEQGNARGLEQIDDSRAIETFRAKTVER